MGLTPGPAKIASSLPCSLLEATETAAAAERTADPEEKGVPQLPRPAAEPPLGPISPAASLWRSPDWLDMDLILPFKIGDFAEAKCFDEGFKGAWFRSKIKDMRVAESGHLEYYLEYIDYTDEADEWIGVFQKNPFNPACLEGKSNDSTEIMLRPSFPRWYMGQQVPKHLSKSEVIARVCDTWKVGDWVDCHNKDCYWTGQIVELTSKKVVEVKFLDHPMGEGEQRSAKKNDLRPVLDWSIIEGWTVPLSAAKGKYWQAAHLVHPNSDVEERSNTDEDDEALGSSSTIKTPSLDTNIACKLSNQMNTILTSAEKAEPAHKSSDPVDGVPAVPVGDGYLHRSLPPSNRMEAVPAGTPFGSGRAQQNSRDKPVTLRTS